MRITLSVLDQLIKNYTSIFGIKENESIENLELFKSRYKDPLSQENLRELRIMILTHLKVTDQNSPSVTLFVNLLILFNDDFKTLGQVYEIDKTEKENRKNVFLNTVEFLRKGDLFTNESLEWIMSIPFSKLQALNTILTLLENNKALENAADYLSLFLYRDPYDIKKQADYISDPGGNRFIKDAYLFLNLMEKIKDKEEILKQARKLDKILCDYEANAHKLSYAGIGDKDYDNIYAFFTDLLRKKKILTPEILNRIDNTVLIFRIDIFCCIIERKKTEEQKFFLDNFGLIVNFLENLVGYDSQKDTIEMIEFFPILKDYFSEINNYSEVHDFYSRGRDLYTGALFLASNQLLTPENFNFIKSETAVPLTSNKTDSSQISRNNNNNLQKPSLHAESKAELIHMLRHIWDDKIASSIKAHPSPHNISWIVKKIPKPLLTYQNFDLILKYEPFLTKNKFFDFFLQCFLNEKIFNQVIECCVQANGNIDLGRKNIEAYGRRLEKNGPTFKFSSGEEEEVVGEVKGLQLSNN